MSNTVRLFVINDRFKEAIAAEAITPGQLITKNSTGKLIKHATAGGNVVPRIAIEQDFIGGDIDKAYAADEQVRYKYGVPGEEYYMWLAAGQNVAIDDPLESAGDGTLQKHTPQAVNEGGTATYTIYTNAVKFVAKEAVDNSGGAEAVRIKVEVV